MVENGKILVSEIFESIDGEGYHAGYPSVFFRVVGCNLRCSWCDSTYSYIPDENSRWMSVSEAFVEIKKFHIKHITITGGEPLMESNERWMKDFIALLLETGYEVDVETNGSIDYEPWKKAFNEKNFHIISDWKAPSSKMNKFMFSDNLGILDERDIIKIVVTDDDFAEVEKILLSGTRAQIYLSPVFNQVTMSKIPEFVIRHKMFTNLRCQVQLHKIFWEPDKRGV